MGKSVIKHDHDFYEKISFFSVKSTSLLKSWFHESFWATTSVMCGTEKIEDEENEYIREDLASIGDERSL